MITWEHKVFACGIEDDLVKHLDSHGQQGWEVVAINAGSLNQPVEVVFKRPRPWKNVRKQNAKNCD